MIEIELIAYLDAGSGSIILQAVVGGLAAVGVAGKIYWRRIKGFFGRKPDETPDTKTEAVKETAGSD